MLWRPGIGPIASSRTDYSATSHSQAAPRTPELSPCLFLTIGVVHVGVMT